MKSNDQDLKGGYTMLLFTNGPQQRKMAYKLLFLLSLVFFVFMMAYKLMNSALWYDEWIEYYFSQKSIMTGDLYRAVIKTFQPPLYNMLMHFWLKVSDSLTWFRLFNVVIGTVGGIFLYDGLCTLCNRITAAIGLIVLACTNLWVRCIQECSEYSLMLVFLIISLCFFVKLVDRYSFPRLTGFLLANVGAIYSQYGAAFVSLPLLLTYFVFLITRRGIEKRTKITVLSSYIGCFIVFAVPLFFFFLKGQLERNEIGSIPVSVSIDSFRDLPFLPGRLIAYFFQLNGKNEWEVFFKIVGLFIVIVSIVIIFSKKRRDVDRLLCGSFLIGYALHYLLTQLHIYAMTHPWEFAGFFSRYSYFYIPLLFYLIPDHVYCIKSSVEDKARIYNGYNVILSMFGGVLLFAASISISNTLKNWHKTYDDQVAEIWMDNRGWEAPTVLLGHADFGFHYYVSHSDGYQDGYDSNYIMETDLNIDDLPNIFFIWNTNHWTTYYWQDLLDNAQAQGYEVKILADHGDAGSLALCSRREEP